MLAAVLTIMFMTTISECRAEEAGEEDRNSEEMSELVEYRNPDTGFRVLVEDDAEIAAMLKEFLERVKVKR